MPKLKEAKKEATKYPLVSPCHSSLSPEKKIGQIFFWGEATVRKLWSAEKKFMHNSLSGLQLRRKLPYVMDI